MGRRGSQIVEASLMLLPLLALALLALDAAWAVFIKGTLQQAVREGTRYGVTGHTTAEMAARVRTHALGLLDGDQAATLAINCWRPGYPKPSPPDAAGCDAVGKLIEISVTNYQIQPLSPLLRSPTPISVTVSSADVLEAVP